MLGGDGVLKLYADVLGAQLPEYDDWLYRYCGELGSASGAQRHEQYLADLVRFGRATVTGRDVLDAGSGFGLTLLTFARWGARSAIGIESYPRMVETANAYLRLLPEELARRMHTELADVAAIPFEADSFDLILSKEAISHYRDVPAFLTEATRVLRPGGVLLIADGNNARNPRVVDTTRKVWRAFEFGDEHLGVHERQGFYRLRRAEIIQAYAPDLPVDCWSTAPSE
jgi:SAM-dependent methyltransferase